MTKKIFILGTLMGLLLTSIIPAQSFGAGSDNLFLRDTPLFYGRDEMDRRLEELRKDGPIWALNLSGGSARAFAHLGVLKRMEEEGLYPDVIVTNSMGSIVGLLYAAGIPLASIEDLLSTVNLANLFDVAVPLQGGIISTYTFQALVQAILGKVDISDFPIPILVVTEDLRTKRQVILARGPADRVMLAAFALPVYFNPENLEDFRLVDGGATNLVPLKPFEGMFDATVVSTTFYDLIPNVYNPLNVLNVTIDIAKSRAAVSQILEYNPFMIRCDVESFSFMAFDKSEELIARGYNSCDLVIDELREYLDFRNIQSSGSKANPAYSAAIARARTMINNKIPLPLDRNVWGVKAEIHSWQAYRDPHYLYPELFLGVKTFFGRPWLSGEVSGLYGGTSGWSGLGALSGSLGGNFNWHLESFWSIPPEEIAENSLPLPVDYHFGEIKYIIPGDVVSVTPFSRFELADAAKPGSRETLIHGGVETILSRRGLTLTENFQIFGHSPPGGDPWVTGVSEELTMRLKLPGLFFGTARAFARIPFNLEERVPLFYNDFFRSALFNLLDEGGLSQKSDYMFPGGFGIANMALAYQFGAFVPNIAEMLLLRESEIALFSDILVTGFREGFEQPRISLGGDLRLNISLLGLRPFDFHILGGWDFHADKPFFMINLGSEIP